MKKLMICLMMVAPLSVAAERIGDIHLEDTEIETKLGDSTYTKKGCFSKLYVNGKRYQTRVSSDYTCSQFVEYFKNKDVMDDLKINSITYNDKKVK